MYLIGVDVGGTFTDLVCTDTESNRTLTHKVLTTAADGIVRLTRADL